MKTLTFERKNALQEVSLILLGSAIISLSGYLSIPLWFTPVPIALQNSTVLLMAGLMGSRRAFLAVALFFLLGMMGLPVYSNGNSGIAYLLGPTGGYLLGYLISSYLVGRLAERNNQFMNGAFALIAGNLVIYTLGAGYLATFVGIKNAFWMGVAPFLFGDLLKTLLSLKIMQKTKYANS